MAINRMLIDSIVKFTLNWGLPFPLYLAKG